MHLKTYGNNLPCQAMRQATNREKAAKIAEKDPFGAVDEQLDKSAASEEANAATMAQVSRTTVKIYFIYAVFTKCVLWYRLINVCRLGAKRLQM